MRRGNEEVCVLEIVRPGMEDSESAEKQENTGIGPASALNRAMSTEVVSSSSCAGRSASKTRVNALMTRASIFFAKCFYEEGWIAGSSPAMTAEVSSPRKRGPKSPPVVMGPGSPLAVARVGRDDSRFSLEHQPAAVRNGRRRNFHCFRLILTMEIATPTCSASEAHITPICHPRCGTIRLCHHPSSSCGTIRRNPTCHHPSS